jgi:glycine betaine/proline transport system substrate-binding protein
VANDEALFVDGRGGRFMRALLLPRLFSLLVLCMLLAGGCGGGGGGGETLEIADIGWTENTAIAQTTKVILEEELGYEEVTVHTSDLDSVYEDVAAGDLDAFQDVWLPNQQDLLGSVEDDVELLGPWYQGQTKQGIGVPSYMEATSLDQLAESEADLLLGIEPSSVVMGTVSEEVILAYDLDQKLVEASTPGMLAEVENRYDSREEFAFIAWSPHWMNQRYDFRYLEDPKDALGELNDPARVLTIVNEDLPEDDPVAYAFMSALTLDEDQLNDLESTINEAGDPLEGARWWARDNRGVWQPWVEAAESARES